MNLSTVWSIARSELSLNRRLFRTWLFVIFAAILSLFSIFGVMVNYTTQSVLSSSAFIYSPLLMLFQMFPTLIFVLTLGIAFLGMEVYSRDKRERIDEVFGTLPVTNAELVFGRAIGITLLMYVTLFVLMLLFYAGSFILAISAPETGQRPIEIYSLLGALLIDAIPNLLLWTALTIFLATLLRNRLFTILIVIGLYAGLTYTQFNANLLTVQLTNTLSVGSILPSEIVPQFTSVQILIQRLAMLLLSGGLLYWAAILIPRLDLSRQTKQAKTLAPALTVAAALCFFLSGYQFFSQVSERDTFTAEHQAVEGDPRVDLVDLTGSVVVDPGDSVTINFDISFQPLRHVDEGESIYFTLNPGFTIDELELDGEESNYTFEQGLITIETPKRLGMNEQVQLTIRADGDPNPRFAYLDSVVDPWKSELMEAVGLFYMGSESSINAGQYVALLPGIAWYPMPGSHFGRENLYERSRDFFSLDMVVEVPNDWHVASVGTANTAESTDSNVFRFTPQSPVHEIGLFASEFERFEKEIGGIQFEVLVTPDNSQNIEVFSVIEDELEERVLEWIQRSQDFGLTFPYETYSIVEVPTYLRTYRGGWNMESAQSLPGLFLIREGSFFTAGFEQTVTDILEGEEGGEENKKEGILALLLNYFNNDVNGGNIVHAALDNVMQFQTGIEGEGAIPVTYVLDYLTKSLIAESESFYSIHTLLTTDAFSSSAIGLNLIASESIPFSLNQFYFNQHINQPPVWDGLVGKSLSEMDFANYDDAKVNLHILYLRGRAMAQKIEDWLGRESSASLLSTVLETYRGQTLTLSELLTLGEQVNTELEPLLGDWLSTSAIPGYRVSGARTVRLPDLEYGMARYESSFLLWNPEPITGLVSVGYNVSAEQIAEQGLEWTDPLKVAGESTYRIALVAEEPIEVILVEPYFSLNREPFPVILVGSRDYETVDRERLPLIAPDEWFYVNPDRVIVDDLDSGFAIITPDGGDGAESNETPFLQRAVLGLATTFTPEPPMDAGLKSFGATAGVPAFNEWTRQQTNEAWGTYRRTLVRVQPGTTLASASFTAVLPRTGTWDLEYFVPRVQGGGFEAAFSGAQINVRTRTQRGGKLTMTLIDGEDSAPVELDRQSAGFGWVRLGQFDLNNRTVQLQIEPSSDRGVVVADAIRWTPAAQ